MNLETSKAKQKSKAVKPRKSPKLCDKPLGKVSMIFLAYNEEKNIEKVVLDFYKKLKGLTNDFEIIVVNDGSADKTGEVVEALGLKEVRVVSHKTNLGYAETIRTGFASAKGDFVGYVDGDGQYSVNDLPAFIEAIKTADIVVGNRTERGDGFKRLFFSKVFVTLNFVILGLHFSDPDCGFKLFRKGVFEKISPVSKQIFISPEMIFKAKKLGLTINEVPVVHLKRLYGESFCFNVGEGLNVVKDMVKLRFNKDIS